MSSPSWAQNLTLAYAYDAISHGFSAFATNPANVSLEVSVTQPNAQGNGWASATFYSFLPDTSKQPYTLRRDFYPTAAGQGGILANTIALTVRKVGTTETITATFTPVNTPYGNPVAVSLDGGNPPTSWGDTLDVAYLYDPNSHGFSAFTIPNGLSLEVAVVQSGASGNGWNSGVFYPLSTANPVSPYTHRRDFFPTTVGSGGILASSVQLIFRKAGTSETATFTFTPANTPGGTPVRVSAGSTVTLPDWAQGFDWGYTHNSGSQVLTAYATANVPNLQVAISQAAASGTNSAMASSSGGIVFYPMTAQSGPGYTHRRDFSGVTSASLVMAFRNADAVVADVETPSFTPVNTTSLLRPGPVKPLPPVPIPPRIGPQTATVGVSFSFIVPTFSDSLFGQPLRYQVSTLPPGLMFTPASRLISGVPTVAGSTDVVVSALNNRNLGVQTLFTITVVEPQTLSANGYQTNPALLNLEAFDIRDGGFSLRNTVTLPAPPMNLAWWYFIGSEQRGYPASAFNSTLRFPKGVPILVEVWVINPNDSRGPDYYRNEGPDRHHAEQLLVVY